MSIIKIFKRMAELVGMAGFLIMALTGMATWLRGTPVFAAAESRLLLDNASVPLVLHYQGEVRNLSGEPLNGTYSIVFNIYDTPTGGTALFSETHSAVVVRDGRFSELLGDTTPLPADFFSSPDRFIGVTVGTDAELLPRQRFGSVPYAYEANHASQASNANQAINADLLDGQHANVLVPPGTVVPFAGDIIPEGWLPCDGASKNRSEYPALFAAIGTVWGADDGATFRVPDLRGRVPVGVGQGGGLSNRILGARGGEEAHVMTLAELAPHNHAVHGTNFTGTPANVDDTIGEYGRWFDNYSTTSPVGSGQPFNIMQPFAVLRYIIKY